MSGLTECKENQTIRLDKGTVDLKEKRSKIL